jgi:hypothetical protein
MIKRNRSTLVLRAQILNTGDRSAPGLKKAMTHRRERELAARADATACHRRLRPGTLVPAATNKENLHGSELSIQDERIWKDERKG